MRGGTRLFFLAGDRVLKYLGKALDNERALTRLLRLDNTRVLASLPFSLSQSAVMSLQRICQISNSIYESSYKMQLYRLYNVVVFISSTFSERLVD